MKLRVIKDYLKIHYPNLFPFTKGLEGKQNGGQEILSAWIFVLHSLLI